MRSRTVLVTGAGRGLGRALVERLAREPVRVLCAVRDPGAFAPLGGNHRVVELDLGSRESIDRGLAGLGDERERIDVLVNNAGALWWADVVDTPMKKFDLIMGINVRASFALSQAVLPHMMAQKYGHIIMMSPPVDAAACAHHGAYAVSKFGMTMIADAIAGEYAEHNITAHALWPATAIESFATINFGLGGPELWRKADILADATLALLSREPSARRGKAWIDEALLREEGVTDFSKYQCVPGVEPPHFPFTAIPKATSTKP